MAPSKPESDPERVDLEAKLTLIERTVEVISSVMHEQGDQLAELERRLLKLETDKAAGGEATDGGIRPHDERPPHY